MFATPLLTWILFSEERKSKIDMTIDFFFFLKISHCVAHAGLELWITSALASVVLGL
jgi:hypothetical protein